MALAFVRLKDWKLRKNPDLKAAAVAKRAMGAFSQFKDGMAFAFSPPAVVELGQANGFDLMLQDRSGLGHEKLMEARSQLLGMAMKNPKLPEFKLDIDDERAGALGLSLLGVNEVLATAWGSSYVNDFIENGRVKKVYLQADAKYRMLPEDIKKWHVRNSKGEIQADAKFRMLPEDIKKWHVRNSKGEMVPFSAFSSAHWL